MSATESKQRDSIYTQDTFIIDTDNQSGFWVASERVRAHYGEGRASAPVQAASAKLQALMALVGQTKGDEQKVLFREAAYTLAELVEKAGLPFKVIIQ